MLGGGDFTPPKTSSKDKSGDPPEPLLAEPAEPLGFLRLDFREVELSEIEALATTSTVRFTLTNAGIEVMVTSDKDAKKVIVWETNYRIPISSFHNNLELHLIRTSQDLLTNQLTRKTLGSMPIDFPKVEILEKGEGGVDDMAITFMPKGKKKPIAKVTIGWQYRAAPNPYSDLDPLLLAPDQAVLRSILNMTVVEGPAGAIMRYFAYSMKAVDLFALAVKVEIGSTNELPQLFRGSSIGTQVISEFLALHGDSFLKDLLRPLVHKVLVKSPDVELDPGKMAKPRDEKEQKSAEKRLVEICTTFLKGISSTIGNCPPAIREVLNLVQVEVEKKFPGKSQIALAGLLFLRFICPAIVTTEKICPGIECTQPSRRALVLVTKVLQNLANDVAFGDKEPFMAALNPFLQANKNYANDIYKKVMKADKKGYDAARYRRRVPVKVYESLFAFACDAKLLTPDQCELIKERVAREIQPPAATVGTLFNGKASPSEKLTTSATLDSARSTSSSDLQIARSNSDALHNSLHTSQRTPEQRLSPSVSREGHEEAASSDSTPTRASKDTPLGSTPTKDSTPSGKDLDLSLASRERKEKEKEKEKEKKSKKGGSSADLPKTSML